MVKKDLTHYQRRRYIQKNQRCSQCGDIIVDSESFVLVKEKVGKRVRYSFYHERCFDGEE